MHARRYNITDGAKTVTARAQRRAPTLSVTAVIEHACCCFCCWFRPRFFSWILRALQGGLTLNELHMREKLIETLMTTLYELRTKVFKKYDQKQMLSVFFFFSSGFLHHMVCCWLWVWVFYTLLPACGGRLQPILKTLFPLDTKKSVFPLKCDRDLRCFHVQVFQTSPLLTERHACPSGGGIFPSSTKTDYL